MAKSEGQYRKVFVRIWQDRTFRELPAEAQRVFLYLLTHPDMLTFGAIRGTIPGLAASLLSRGSPCPEKSFRESMATLRNAGMVEVDLDGIVALPNFLTHNAAYSAKQVQSWPGRIDTLPECPLQRVLWQRVTVYVKTLEPKFQEAFHTGADALSRDLSKALSVGDGESPESPIDRPTERPTERPMDSTEEGIGNTEEGIRKRERETTAPKNGGRARKEKPVKKPRERDPVWDWLVDKFHPSGLSKDDRGRMNRVRAALKAKDATSEQVEARVAYYESTEPWSRLVCTATAIAKHWDRLVPKTATPNPILDAPWQRTP